MILNEVLVIESNTFDQDAMVDIFVEGFLYALEMQEEGKKASSIEELSNTLSEAANVSINELSTELKKHSIDVAINNTNKHFDHAMREVERGNKKLRHSDISNVNNDNARMHYIKSLLHLGVADKNYEQAKRIENKLNKKKQ